MNQSNSTQLWSALMFILSGIIFLLEEITQRELWHKYWPVLIITTGFILLWEALKMKK